MREVLAAYCGCGGRPVDVAPTDDETARAWRDGGDGAEVWRCPDCGARFVFSVDGPTWKG